jgi:hypothetical protein
MLQLAFKYEKYPLACEIALLDATYRTTRYSLPLYFLCVPTNVNYINVATFVTETEDSSSLIEALQVIKEWNPSIKCLGVCFPNPDIYTFFSCL